jgi:hypothetical protein
MLPVPTKLRINLAIIARDPTEVEDETYEANEPQEEKKGDRVYRGRIVGIFETCAKTSVGPKACEVDSKSPEEKGASITLRTRGR